MTHADLFGYAANLFSGDRYAGVDEVGIGPLAGPVTAAAVILHPSSPIDGLHDSKRLTAKRRAELVLEIEHYALSFGLGWASEAEIDAVNILQASHLAMRRALAQLSVAPELVYIDGNKTISLEVPCIAVVKGDGRVPQISAASILAKEARDALMGELDATYPEYGFAQNKGYPTRAHMAALEAHGPCPIHRKSFAPVAEFCTLPTPGAESTATAKLTLEV
ncbi:MAG: ribonuclease HII [Pseudomonadota bacterium]